MWRLGKQARGADVNGGRERVGWFSGRKIPGPDHEGSL